MPSFTLDSIVVNRATLPPRIVIHGDHGIGKTTFAADPVSGPPSPIVLRTEDGLSGIHVPAFPLATSYGDVVAAINTLVRESHEFKTFVLDSLDWLEPLVWQRTAREGGKEDIEDFGYGKGYKKADEFWLQLLAGFDALRAKGMTVILLAHTSIKRFDSPDVEPYDRYQIKLHKGAAALIQEWADVVGFAHYEVNIATTDVGFNKTVSRGVGAGVRVLSVEERPAYDAKNRYKISGPASNLPLSWQALATAIAPAYAPPPKARRTKKEPAAEAIAEPAVEDVSATAGMPGSPGPQSPADDTDAEVA